MTQSQRTDWTLAFTYRRSSTSPSEILDALHCAGVKILDIQTEQPYLQDVFLEITKQLNADGMTVILTTHYLEEAQEMCDQIAIIHEGALRALDTTVNLLSKLDTKTLVVEIESTTKISLPAGVTQSQRTDGTLAFSYSRSSTSPGEILDALRRADVTILDIQTEQPDLQDVFLEITKQPELP